MPILQDFTLATTEDGTLSITMTPATPIGGWSIQFLMTNRANGVSGIILCSVASGYNGQSGITIVNSGTGQFNISLFGSQMSGFNYGNYFYLASRTDSGFHTNLSEGFRLCPP